MQTMQILREQGHASVSKLSEHFGVSEVTIRKDLRALEEQNLLVRTHGGAVLKDHFMYDIPFEKQAERHAEEKRRIARAAADLVHDHDTVLLGYGATTVQIARQLRSKKNLTVTTDSIHVAVELLGSLENEVVVLGGHIRPTTGSVVGPFAEQMLHGYAFNKFFLGVDGFDRGHGFTTTSMMIAHLYRVMLAAAQEITVVMDSSKVGRRGLAVICDTHEIHRLITDDLISSDVVRQLEGEGVEVMVV